MGRIDGLEVMLKNPKRIYRQGARVARKAVFKGKKSWRSWRPGGSLILGCLSTNSIILYIYVSAISITGCISINPRVHALKTST